MMYCTKCGFALPDSASFCKRCGAPVRTGSSKATAPQQAPIQQGQQVQQAQQVQQTRQAQQAQPPQASPSGAVRSNTINQAAEAARSAVRAIMRDIEAPSTPGEFVAGTWSAGPSSSFASAAMQAAQGVQGAVQTFQNVRGAAQMMQTAQSPAQMPVVQNAQAQGAPMVQSAQAPMQMPTAPTAQNVQAQMPQHEQAQPSANQTGQRTSRKPTIRYSSGKKNR